MVDFRHGKICYLFMPSQDPARSGAFYRDVFGWTLRTNGEGSLSFDDSTGQVSGTWVTGGECSPTSTATGWASTSTAAGLNPERVLRIYVLLMSVGPDIV